MRRLALVLLAAPALAGCGSHFDSRTGYQTMNIEIVRTFKRSYAGAVRMRTNRTDGDAIRHAIGYCRATAPEPKSKDVLWPWRCRLKWFRRGVATARVSTYGIKVDSFGCFEARTADFPYRLPERVLDGRPARNPLVYMRSCP